MAKSHNAAPTELSKNLGKLLASRNLTVTALSRLAGVGQPILFRIMTSEIKQPKVGTVAKISQYFGVTVDQMIGLVPLPKNLNQYSGWRSIPLLTMEELVNPQLRAANTKTEYTEMGHSEDCYAVHLDGRSMEPRFCSGDILVADPNPVLINSATDGDYVLVRFSDQKHAQFRQLLIEGDEKYYKPLNPDFGGAVPAKKAKILAVVVQSKALLKG